MTVIKALYNGYVKKKLQNDLFRDNGATSLNLINTQLLWQKLDVFFLSLPTSQTWLHAIHFYSPN